MSTLGVSMLMNRRCSLLGLAFAAVGSLMPDIDTAKSVVGRLVFWLSSPWEKHIGHRTLAHSMLGIAGFALLTSPLYLFHQEAAVLLVAGYVSHIALDTTSKRGCDLFYPSRLRAVLPGNAEWRFIVGGKGEMVLLLFLIAACALLYPAAQLGLEGVLDRLSGDFARAHRELAAADGARQHWLTGTLRNTLTEQTQVGRYRVVGKSGPQILLLIDDEIFATGKADAAHLYPLDVYLEKGVEYRTEVTTVNLSGHPLSALHAALQPGIEHWLFGVVQLAEPLALAPSVGRYTPLTATGTALQLHYARWADVLPYAGTTVDNGLITVRHNLLPGDESTGVAAVPLLRPKPPREPIAVTLTLNSLESLQVEVGGFVSLGDPLAIDPEIDRKIADLHYQISVLRTPVEEPQETPELRIVGNPEALLRQGIIDKKEYLQITKAKTRKQARTQRVDLRIRSLATKLAMLEEQRIIRAKIAGEIESIRIVAVQQETITVELQVAPLDERSSAAMQLAAGPAATAAPAGNTRVKSFERAKKLAPQIYADRLETFYCGCSYTGKKINLARCGYQPKSNRKRAQRLEWEHIVPAAAFGQAFSEWRDGHPECVDSRGKAFKGRNCAKKMALTFRLMEGDLHNLQPAIGEVNGRRSNYSMAMIEGERREFGACDVEIAERKVEPRPEIRGDIARIYHYMDAAYPGRGIVSEKNRKLFAAWAQEDPVDAWECERDQRIARLQGNANPFVQAHCR